MSNFLMIAFILAVLAGLVGIVCPRWIRLSSRLDGVALLVSSFVFVGIAIEFFPEEGAEPSSGVTIALLIIAGLVTLLLQVRKRELRLMRESPPARRPVKVAPPKKDAFLQFLGRKRDYLLPSEKSFTWMPGPEKPDDIGYWPGNLPDDDVEDAPEPIRPPARKALRSRSDISYQKDRTGGGRVGRWGPIWRRGGEGEELHFEYVDAQGEVTERWLVRWVEYRAHITGICLTSHASRTFRKDGVRQWFDGSEGLLRRA